MQDPHESLCVTQTNYIVPSPLVLIFLDLVFHVIYVYAVGFQSNRSQIITMCYCSVIFLLKGNNHRILIGNYIE